VFKKLSLPDHAPKYRQNQACVWILTQVGRKVDQAMLGPFPLPWSLNFMFLDYLEAL